MEESAPADRPGFRNPLNLLALAFVLLSCVICFGIAAFFSNPNLVPVAFRPPTLPAVVSLTPAPPATDTPVATPTPLPTRTPAPRNTKTPAPTATLLDPSETSTGTATPPPTLTPTNTAAPFTYVMQGGKPAYIANYANGLGCNWMGIGGQAFNLEGGAVAGLVVHLAAGAQSDDALTGDPRFTGAYGPSGYEFTLLDHPTETDDVYTIQLLSSSGQPLSDIYPLTTYAGCDKNLLLINFVKVR